MRLGELEFTLERFNIGSNVNQGHRNEMEDGLLMEEISGCDSLINLFCVIDGHGGIETMEYIKKNLKKNFEQSIQLLNKTQDVNRELKEIVTRTLFQMDYQFFK